MAQRGCVPGRQRRQEQDKPFDLPDAVNQGIQHILSLNKNTIVSVSSGSGVNMSQWNKEVGAILYNWYPGQIGFRAFAEIVAGKTNPSAKLPITIEQNFEDSPGYGYIPVGSELYSGWEQDHRIIDPIQDVVYDEGVFIGYRWYESKNIKPLYAFGYGLSYTTYAYSNLILDQKVINSGSSLSLSVDVKNTGTMDGQEIMQLYVRDIEASVPRPDKELKGFQKVNLKGGDKKTVHFNLVERDFSFWDVETQDWKLESGFFEILIGSASNNILVKEQFEIK